jgi:hypothetical protein
MLSFARQSGEIIRDGARESEMVNIIVGTADGGPPRSFVGSFCQFFSEREIFRPIEGGGHSFSHQLIGEDEVPIGLGRIDKPPLDANSKKASGIATGSGLVSPPVNSNLYYLREAIVE